MIKKMQGTIKENSASLALILTKLISGFVVGLAFAIAGKTLLDYGSFAFTMVIVIAVGAFIKMSSKWKFAGVLLFDLFCVMTALLMRMYIHIAPGA